MTSLTRISIITRKIIRYGLYSIIFIILARAAILTSIRVYRHFYPIPPPPPTVSFGKLPNLTFPQKESTEGLTYILETPEGGLPVFPTQEKVYFMPKISPNLLSLEAAKEKAGRLGFSRDGEKKSETLYEFPNLRAPSALKMNMITGVFSISYSLKEDQSPMKKRPPPAEVAATQARSHLSSADLFPEDLTGPTIPEYIRIENEDLVGALSLSDADFVKINFLRKDFDEKPSLTANPEESNVWFIVSGSSKREHQIVAAEYHYFPVDEEVFATYPIKTAQAAWEELQAGGGYIARLGTGKSNNIIIRRVYLAYYDPPVPAEFYQPIVVFEGDKEFRAFIPAINYEYYGE